MSNLNTNAVVDSFPAAMRIQGAEILNMEQLKANAPGELLKAVEQTPAQMLEQLEAGRVNWDHNEYRSSRERLYEILTDCYRFYFLMKKDSDSAVRKEHSEALSKFNEARGHKFTSKSSPMHKIVKAVFGVDRRRISAYATTLNFALKAGPESSDGKPTAIQPSDLVTWIEEQGGVEEVRKGGSASANGRQEAKDEIEQAKAWVSTRSLTLFEVDPNAVAPSTDDVDKLILFIVSATPSGKYELKAVVRNDTVTNAAARAHYRATAEERKNGEAEAQANNSASRIANA